MPTTLGSSYIPSKSFFQRNDFDNIKLSEMAPESKDFTDSTWSSNPSVMLNTAKALEWTFGLCLFPKWLYNHHLLHTCLACSVLKKQHIVPSKCKTYQCTESHLWRKRSHVDRHRNSFPRCWNSRRLHRPQEPRCTHRCLIKGR